MKRQFYQHLESFLRQLHRRQRCGLIIAMLLATVLDLWIISFISQWTGIREFTALIWVSVILSAGLAVGIALLFIHQKDKAGVRQLGTLIEQEHPELMDTLHTAIDYHALPDSRQSAFTLGVFQKANNAIEHLPWRQALMPFWLKPGVLLFGLVLATLLTAAISQTELLRKAGHGWQDWRAGSKSGIQIQPEQLGIPRDSDITIRADILRWEDAAEIQYRIAGENFRFPMSASRDGDRRFTFYGVSESIRFRVITPSLVSDWKKITPYTPPRIEAAKMEVKPPVYTKIDSFKLDHLDNLQVPEGSEIQISLTTRYTNELKFRSGQESEAFQQEPAEVESDDPVVESHRWTYTLNAKSNKTWKLHMSNEDVATESAEYRIQVIPDERPVVEILKPGKDIQLEPEENLYLEIYAADDYGLSAMVINLSIAGRFQEQIPIRPRGPDGEREPLETRMPTAVDFSTLNVEEGELVSYWVTVSDNREPDPQHTRSEVYFVEVRTEQEPEEADGMPEEEERINLRAHIEEMKRLIRLSHRAVSSLDNETRMERNQQITSGLTNLRGELNELFEELRPQLEQMGDQFFTRGFQSVDGLLSAAGRLVTENQTESAIGSQEQALQELIAMENALRRETISREPSEGEEGESGEGMEGDSEEAPDPSSMADLRDLIEELQSISDAQNAQNSQVDRAGRVGSDAEELQQLLDRQDGLRTQTRELERNLQNFDGFGDVANIIGEGSRRMREAAEQLRRQDPERAWRDGIRAQDALEMAARILQDRVDQSSQRALENLENQARQLAQQQGQAAGESGEAAQSGGDSEAMLNRQQQLNEQWQELLEQMDALAQEMAASNPEASRALNQTARSAQQGDPSNSMTRAANALLYERFEQAEGLQDRASQALEEIAGQIRQAGESMSALSAEQLQRLIEELGRDQQNLSNLETPVDSEDAERIDAIREQWAERLAPLGQQMGDGPLNGIADALGESGDSEADVRLGESIELLQQAEASLRQYRDRLQRRQFFQSQRRSAPPPEQYRQQVESYFRRLAEEEEP